MIRQPADNVSAQNSQICFRLHSLEHFRFSVVAFTRRRFAGFFLFASASGFSHFQHIFIRFYDATIAGTSSSPTGTSTSPCLPYSYAFFPLAVASRLRDTGGRCLTRIPFDVIVYRDHRHRGGNAVFGGSAESYQGSH